MARKTKVVLVCDRHRGHVEAVGSVEIGLDGNRRRIDLCAEHRAEFQKMIKPWLPAGAASRTRRRSSKAAAGARSRRAAAASSNGGGTKAAARAAATAAPGDANAIRAWARQNGYAVGARGRIPAPVRQAYSAATGN